MNLLYNLVEKIRKVLCTANNQYEKFADTVINHSKVNFERSTRTKCILHIVFEMSACGLLIHRTFVKLYLAKG
jgi:hypothetical protein